MEKLVNEVVFRLGTKIPKENVEIVRNVLYLVLKDYEITEKTTEIAVVENDLLREAKVYLAARHIDGLSDGTLVQYKRTLDRFFLIVHKDVKDITTEDCRIFFYKIQEQNHMGNRSLDTQRSYMMAFFTWIVDNEYINRNPMTPIRPFKYEKKIKKALTDMEIEKLRHASKNTYERAIIEVLYSTACRVSELVNIKLEDINLNTGDVYIMHGKGKKQRLSYLNAKAIIAIQEYIKDRNYPSVYLFENFRKPHNQLKTAAIQRKMRELEKRTGIRVHPHKLRRTTATHLWKKGMPLEEIQVLLGHDDISTTLIYTKVNAESVKQDHNKYMY